MTKSLFLIALECNEAEKRSQVFGSLASSVTNESHIPSLDSSGFTSSRRRSCWADGSYIGRRCAKVPLQLESCAPTGAAGAAEQMDFLPWLLHLGSVTQEVPDDKSLQHL